MSLRVQYDYAPEVTVMHQFVRSEQERNLDSDMLMKHFIPAYVSGTINYRADVTDSAIPDNDQLTQEVINFINLHLSGETLEYSDITQFMLYRIDPTNKFTGSVKKFTLTARVYNTDGSTSVLTGEDNLIVSAPSPFPKDTTKPVSPRISHWIADNIVLVRS